jgi:hypothetical protein
VVVRNGWAKNASAALFMQGHLCEEEARQMMRDNMRSGTTWRRNKNTFDAEATNAHKNEEDEKTSDSV